MNTRRGRARFGSATVRYVALVAVLGIGAAALVVTAPPASAAGCPTVDGTTHAVWPPPEADVKWPGCNLVNADLTNSDLSGANLTGANLNGADLFNANLTGARLDEADLRNANFADAVLTSASAINADFAGANINGSELSGAALTGAKSGSVLGTPLALPTDWHLVQGYLAGPGANLALAGLPSADLTGFNLTAANLDGANLQGAQLANANLTGAGLTTANLASVTAGGTSFHNAHLVITNLSNAQLGTADLTGVESSAISTIPASLPPNWSLVKGYLIGAEAYLHGAKLAGADLSDAQLTGADLSVADLLGADLSSASLTAANLSGADLRDSTLTGADLQLADLDLADVWGVRSGSISGSPSSLPDGWILEGGYLIGQKANLTDAHLAGLDLRGVDLSGAELAGADLTNTRLTGTYLNLTRMGTATLNGVISGGVTGTPGSLPPGWSLLNGFLIGPQGPSGLLRVTTSPAVASQISVDGIPRDTWGLRWVQVAPGFHQVCFGAVSGFSEPGCQNVTVAVNATTTVTGTFTPRGFLRVVTSPAVGSQIKVDGIPRNNWGMWTDVPTGSHQVCFGAVAGYTAPSCQTVAVTSGATTTVTGSFTASTGTAQSGVGYLRVTTSPAVKSQILIDGNIADSWGLNWMEITPGTHGLCFTRVEGYTEPACQVVTVSAGATTAVAGVFKPRGYLKVDTSPALAGTVLVNGLPADAWGVYTDLAPGSYHVCFGSVPGKTAPACKDPVVTAGATSTIAGAYS